MRKLVLWVSAVSLLLAACASTKPTTASKPADGAPPGDATIAVGTAPGALPTGAPEATAPSGGGTQTSSGVAGIGSSPATGGGTSSTKNRATFGPPGQGVTATKVKIGFWFLNTDRACAAIGATGQTPGCTGTRQDREEAKALTDWVNKHGGVAGRKLETVVYETLANNTPWTAQAEAACEHFAVDEKVFLAIAEGQLGRPYFMECMAKKGIPVIEPGFWTWDQKEFQRLAPYLYTPSRPRAERWLTAYVDGLAQQGFFKGDVTVGLFRYQSATHDRMTETVLKPRLARYGVRLAEEAVIGTPPSVAALGDMNAELSSHVLRFKTTGVNRVLFYVGMGEFHFFYFRQADTQKFNPLYGLSSFDYLTLSAGNAPPGQLENAIAVGWAPGFDTPLTQDPGLNAAARECKVLMERAGLNDPWKGRNTKCDDYFFLKQVLDRVPAVNARGIRAVVESLGTSFQPAAVFTTKFGPTQFDGPSTWRPMKFDIPCKCFIYRGGSRAF